jgi:glutamate synthase (NADPH/NADH) small chain
MRLGPPDASGRRTPEEIEGANFERPATLVIKALGFEPEDLPAMFAAYDLKVSRWGTVKIDFKSQMSNLDGVFAAGDIVRGASLVVWAIRDGFDAAASIVSYLDSKMALAAVAAE